MKAHDYAPTGPIEERPRGGYVPPAERKQALLDALDGVPLGGADRQVIGSICRYSDDSTVRTVVSLILRARAAGPHPDEPREDAR